MQMRIARRFVISGRVQGVGFRYFVQSVAIAESLTGWVRNLDDGRVETAAAGDYEAMDRFEHALRQGPSSARVDGSTPPEMLYRAPDGVQLLHCF